MNNNFLSKNLLINKSENHLWLIDSTENIEEDIKFFIEDQLHDSNQVIFFHELLQNALENIENEEIKLATHHSQFLPLRAKTILAREKFFDTLQILNLIFDAYSKFDQDKFKSQTIVFDMTWIFEAAISSEIIIELEKKIINFIKGKEISSISIYQKQYFKPSLLNDVFSAYENIIVHGSIYKNFYFSSGDREEFHRIQQDQLNRTIETLVALTKSQKILIDSNQQIQHSESTLDMLHAIIESMGDGVFVTDKDGLMLYCNKSSERVLGYGLLNMPLDERARLIGNYYPDKITRYNSFDLPIAKATRGISVDNEIIFIMNDRRPKGVWVSINGRPLTDKNGEIIGGLVVFRDITKQKEDEDEKIKLEEQMFRTQKLESLGVLSGGIAHDFNNLLMGVLGNSDLALKELDPNSTTYKRLQNINLASKRLADLTSQLLAYSGKSPYKETLINVNELIDEMQNLLKPAISKKVTINLNLSSQTNLIKADATQIRQIIMNLITNASDALGDKVGLIEITTGVKSLNSDDFHEMYTSENIDNGTYVYLEVKDNGSGMKQETIDKIFDPFFTTKFTGRGLGLAAVLGIVRHHKGALKVKSKFGLGSTFTIFFPESSEKLPQRTDASKQVKTLLSDGAILLVDDEENVQSVTSEMLNYFGFSVIQAISGKEAIEQLKKNPEKVVLAILDLTMPDMNGEEVFCRLKEINPNLKIILSSGYHQSFLTKSFDKSQVNGYLQKPYTSEQLKLMIREAL